MNQNPGFPNQQPSQDDSVQPDAWQAQAEFWKLKYFELLLHTQQVITMLNAPMLQHIRAQRAQAAKVANGQ